MVESQSLKLVFASASVHEKMTEYVTRALKNQGYDAITPSVLGFLSALECGVNYGSDIARNLGVSRQMVAKTVKELCALGYLEQLDSGSRQKQIVFTEQGELLMAQARQELASLDRVLANQVGEKHLTDLVARLDELNRVLAS